MATKNHKALPIEDPPAPSCEPIHAFSMGIYPSDDKPPTHDSEIFVFGRSTGFKMGTSCGAVETTICSWKLDEEGILRKAITWASVRFNPFMIFIPTLISALGGPVIRVQQSLTSSGGLLSCTLPARIIRARATLWLLRTYSLTSNG